MSASERTGVGWPPMPNDDERNEEAPTEKHESEKKTWTAEEIEEWEEENEGICPAFKVEHRPERKPVVKQKTMSDKQKETRAEESDQTEDDPDNEQSDEGDLYNVQLRVTNTRTGVSQIHDVLVNAESEDAAPERAKEETKSTDEDEFYIMETMKLTGE